MANARGPRPGIYEGNNPTSCQLNNTPYKNIKVKSYTVHAVTIVYITQMMLGMQWVKS